MASATPLPLLAAGEPVATCTGEPNMADERVPRDRRAASRSTSWRATSSRRFRRGAFVPGARRWAARSTGGCASRTRRRTCSTCGCSGMELAGSSPEPLVRVEGRRVLTRPIAGTRPRGLTEVRDRLLEHELLADPKEQAEHAMLVDLARNDLGRVCVAGTRPPHRADGGRAVLQGDAHRLDGRGRPAARHGAVRRARRRRSPRAPSPARRNAGRWS